ncbi:hypothetical protein [Nostoc sp. CCY0012]|uniref:hypothetical protein n=1 Tax=Nostoc sp. CCY0012 TaxID=1056123 RepID=UPI0039C639D6
MKHSTLQAVTLSLLQTEARQMMAMCFWKNSHHWSSQPLPTTKDSAHVVIRVVYFQTVNWVGFNFCKYHAQGIRIFQQLPKNERLFYEVQPNCYTKFPVWCIDSQHFANVIDELNHCAGIDLKFIVSSPNQIPEIFQPLNLTFSEREQRKRRSRGTVSVNR